MLYLQVHWFSSMVYMKLKEKAEDSSPSFSLHLKYSSMSTFSPHFRDFMCLFSISCSGFYLHLGKEQGKVCLLHISEAEVFLSRPALQFTFSPALPERSSFSTTSPVLDAITVVYWSYSNRYIVISHHGLHLPIPDGYVCVHAKSLQLYPTLCDPVDRNLPGSSDHGIL